MSKYERFLTISNADRRELYRHYHFIDSNSDGNLLLMEAEKIARVSLPYVHRNIGNFTGHDVNHSLNVIFYTNRIIDVIKENSRELSQTEILLLYLAGWLHDIGNLYSRDNHSEESCTIIKLLEGKFIDLGELRDPLMIVVRNHQSRYELEDIKCNDSRVNGDVVRLRLLCGLFKLADECHMGEDRASRIVYHILKADLDKDEKALPKWRANRSVVSVDFDLATKGIILSVSDIEASKELVEKLDLELRKAAPFVGEFFPIDHVEIRPSGRYEQ